MSMPVIPLAEFDQEMANTRRLLERVPTEKSLKHGENVLLSAPRSTVVRMHLSHLIHHRGQLTVYARLLDVPVPPIYGPTADEQW